jgi:hypothetical protein
MWIPSPEIHISLCIVRVAEGVAEDVAEDGVLTPDTAKSYAESESQRVADGVAEKAHIMSPNNQYAAKTAQREREPSPAPQGGVRSPLGSAQSPLRLSNPNPSTEEPKRKPVPLTREQSEILDKIAGDFRIWWTKWFHFDPDKTHTHALLRNSEPLAVFLAYWYIQQPYEKRMNNNLMAKFFCRFSEGRDPGFSKPFHPEFLSHLMRGVCPNGLSDV